MAILRKAGAIVEEILPSEVDLPESERGKLILKVPNDIEYRKLLKLDMMNRSGVVDIFELHRTRFGVMIDRLENFSYEDGTPIVVEKDAEGRLTPRCMASIMPLVEEISLVLERYCRITRVDRKNSPSPSPTVSGSGQTTA